MKKELFVHFSFLLTFSILVSLMRGWFNISFIPFILGGVVGTLLPDIDHLLYVYVLKPYELTPQRAMSMVGQGRLWDMLTMLAETRRERKHLIFHTVTFEIIFMFLAFLIVSSSGNIFGTGIVLAVFLHLLVDQFIDFLEIGSLENWFWQLNIQLEKDKTVFFFLSGVFMLLFLGFLV